MISVKYELLHVAKYVEIKKKVGQIVITWTADILFLLQWYTVICQLISI